MFKALYSCLNASIPNQNRAAQCVSLQYERYKPCALYFQAESKLGAVLLLQGSFPDSDLVYKWSKAEECGEPNGSVHGVDHVQLSRFNITRCAAYSKLRKGVFGE